MANRPESRASYGPEVALDHLAVIQWPGARVMGCRNSVQTGIASVVVLCVPAEQGKCERAPGVLNADAG